EGTIVSPSLAPAPVPAPAAALAQASPAPRQTPQALDSAKPAATSMALPGFTPPNGPAATATTDQTQPDRLSWLLGTDPTLRRVLIRTLMGYAPYLMALISVAYCVETGLMAVSHARYLALCLILTPTLMFAIVRSGVTQKLKDPALTLIQIMLATTATSALYATTSYAHAGQLMTLVMVLTVGVCNMSMRQSWITCIYAIGLMSGLMYVMSGQQPLVYEPRVEMGNWILMMFNLPVLMFMGWNLDKLRSRLKKQRAQLKEGVARLSELATRDELTGLNNRGHMNEMLAHYTRRYEQCRESFTVALIDLDHFKRINDQHGHSVGDEVLQAFAHQATETLRQIDVVARWGGEEFLVLCPQSSTDQAMVGLERLRRVFTEIKGSDSVPDLRASFSAGLSTPRDGESIEATLARADNALYEAKRSGRNRICVSQPTPESKTAASVD
ncbi:MAG: GGDEF domain-containing protein, partial [Pseudomonadota bacterium]